MGCWGMMILSLSLLFTLTTAAHHDLHSDANVITDAEKLQLKEQAKEMFYHAYRSYMNKAYPADELMPLSCRGRFRDTEPSRGDIDEALGNFSLTLIDTLDTLAVMNDLEEFEHAVRLIVRDVRFDSDVVVSVFETNIRALGGLLSSHILATYLRDKLGRMEWYETQLLEMAKDLGYRLIPAFNTTTGIPHAKINLRYGLKSPQLSSSRETCTACAGTMILEFAALSRLTGEPIFEEKAHKAMDHLWQLRHRASDLMGTVLNIHSGDWVRRDSGVGAGIDSYYEYLLKAYILLGDETYLDRFNKHYSAVMKYIQQGPLLVDVHMHRPHTNSRNFMDALLAFWPGLQVLKGDIRPAIETHEMLYQVLQRHNFLPEAFTTDFQVHWGQHPLRPEFLESTYFLYKATGDPYYLEVGKNVLDSLQKYARVPCGFAAVKDVRTGTHEDRMDSFVLAETFKYLYLLFAEKSDLILDIDDFLFTTEAHLLPLTLARLSNNTMVPRSPNMPDDDDEYDADQEHMCPNTNYLFPGNKDFAHTIRQPLKNLVEGVCPKTRVRQRQLRAVDFQAGHEDHLRLLRKMGISIMALPDGRMQLLHTTTHAESAEDAEEGLLFMQEMIELSKTAGKQPSQRPRIVRFTSLASNGKTQLVMLNAGPAQFGVEVTASSEVRGQVAVAEPIRCCNELHNAAVLRGRIALVERGDCMFVEKARLVQKAGAISAIVIDNSPGTSSNSLPLFAMSGDGRNDVTIPVVFLYSEDAAVLMDALRLRPQLEVTITEADTTLFSVAVEASLVVICSVGISLLSNREAGRGPDEEEEDSSSSPGATETLSSKTSADSIPLTSEKQSANTSPEVIYIKVGEGGHIHAETLRQVVSPDGKTTVVKHIEPIGMPQAIELSLDAIMQQGETQSKHSDVQETTEATSKDDTTSSPVDPPKASHPSPSSTENVIQDIAQRMKHFELLESILDSVNSGINMEQFIRQQIPSTDERVTTSTEGRDSTPSSQEECTAAPTTKDNVEIHESLIKQWENLVKTSNVQKITQFIMDVVNKRGEEGNERTNKLTSTEPSNEL